MVDRRENTALSKILKVKPAQGYPPEEGCYLRGNDYSPIAVAVILRWRREETPLDLERLVRVAVESGAALAGTIQTENIGLEKVICNLVANPNIRYLAVCGPESPGHLVGDAILALSKNGIDSQRRIIAAQAPTPFLFNIAEESIARFRRQITVINLVNEGSPEILRDAVCASYQEEPTRFRTYTLSDPGAFPEPPLSGKITWRVANPQQQPKTETEQRQVERLQSLSERIRKAVQQKRSPDPNG
jgi:tetrahydromethanopterin S-methyltransferase subunit A